MLKQAIGFSSHWLRASSRFGTHSPFVYDFVTKVLPHSNSAEGKRIEELRVALSRDKRMLDIDDYGSGYAGQAQAKIQKQLREVVISSGRPRRSGEFLRRLTNYYQPKHCLELGTNLGFSSLYQITGFTEMQFTSVEGSSELLDIARSNLSKFGYHSELVNSTFEQALSKFEKEGRIFDHILLDGHHDGNATISYAKRLIALSADNACLIIDDINWSPGMRKAWEEIRRLDSVTVSIDLYFMGVCFLKRKQAKESFQFRFVG